MGTALYFPNQHPLKKEIHERRIKLWHLRHFTGVSESKLSRCLNGVEVMPRRLEERIKQFLRIAQE